jgi:hypothetical protein
VPVAEYIINEPSVEADIGFESFNDVLRKSSRRSAKNLKERIGAHL